MMMPGERPGFEAICAGDTTLGLDPAELLGRFAATRDEAAFAALVARHGPMVLATCRRIIPHRADADDAFQATFLVLARRASSIHDPDRLAPWLHRVARHVALRARGRAARRRMVEGVRPDELAATDPPADLGELRGVLDEELARLPAKYRAPLVLCYLEGLTHDEAAGRLRWPVGTVRSRLAGGRDRLRGRLARRGFAPGSIPLPPTLPLAAVSRPLQVATVRLALAAPLQSAAAPAAALAHGALTAMFVTKIQSAAVAALAVAATLAAGTAGAVLARQQPVDAPKADPAAIPPAPAPAPAGTNPIDQALRQEEERRAVLKREESALARELERIMFDSDDQIKQLKERLEAKRDEVRASQSTIQELIAGSRAAPTAAEPTEVAALKAQVNALEAELAKRDEQDKAREARARALDGAVEGMHLAAGRLDGAGVAQTARPAGAEGAGPAANPGRDRPVLPPTVETLPGSPTLLMVTSAARDRVTLIDPATRRRATLRFNHPLESIRAVAIQDVSTGGGPGLVVFAMTGPRIEQAAVFDRAAMRWFEHDLPQPASYVRPVWRNNSTLFGFSARYLVPTRELIAFDAKARSWPTVTLPETVSGFIPGDVSNHGTVTFEAGRFLAILSQSASKGSVPELKQATPRRGIEAEAIRTVDARFRDFHDGRLIVPDGDLIRVFDPKTAEWTTIDTDDDK